LKAERDASSQTETTWRRSDIPVKSSGLPVYKESPAFERVFSKREEVMTTRQDTAKAES